MKAYMNKFVMIAMAAIFSCMLAAIGWYATIHGWQFIKASAFPFVFWPSITIIGAVGILIILMWVVLFRLARPFWRAARM